jgi:GrpB-like predicted nucleotidyltransferase (UPF0157 family)
MLGLKHGTVRLVEHNPRWAPAFLAERVVLAEALDGLSCQIEHIGSTAIAGLPAKPILDIAVGMTEPGDLRASIARLQRVGYDYRGDAGDGGGHVFVRASGAVRTHHVHVVALGGDQWRKYLMLRDRLRADAGARERYAAAKRALADRFPEDRQSYTDGKDEVIDRLLREATGA